MKWIYMGFKRPGFWSGQSMSLSIHKNNKTNQSIEQCGKTINCFNISCIHWFISFNTFFVNQQEILLRSVKMKVWMLTWWIMQWWISLTQGLQEGEWRESCNKIPYTLEWYIQLGDDTLGQQCFFFQCWYLNDFHLKSKRKITVTLYISYSCCSVSWVWQTVNQNPALCTLEAKWKMKKKCFIDFSKLCFHLLSENCLVLCLCNGWKKILTQVINKNDWE